MPAKKPNIIIMYADDLGFGDVGCYGGEAIPTPNIDRLAAGGLRFTDGYATAATCTPSRYSLLTGEYPWRNPQAAILPGDAPLIIDTARATLPSLLRDAGYTTGVVGKWHLGIGDGDGAVDWNKEISGTPNDIGFDYSCIMGATNDRVPCVYVENRSVVGLDPDDPIEVTYDHDRAFAGEPTGRDNPELLKMRFSHGHDCSIVNGVSRIGYMRGGTSALWVDEEMADVFSRKAIEFVEQNAERPFFLYYAFHEPHVPRLPHPRFVGSTTLGPRGDVIVEMDWCVGQMLDALDRLDLADDTIVIFSSDNGPVLDDGYEDGAAELVGEHRPAGPLRGGKYSRFDGGTRVPFILRYPNGARTGESHALVSQMDFAASFASLAGVPLPENAAVDSVNVLDALFGKDAAGRAELVTEGIQAKTLLRSGEWAFLPAIDGPRYSGTTGNETGFSHWDQLYDLGTDMGQKRNLASDRPDLVGRFRARLDEIQHASHTRKK